MREKNNDLFEEEKESRPTTLGSVILNFFDFLKTVIIIVALAALIRLFVIQPFIVDGQSMEPTFQNNDYLITEKVSLRLQTIRRGEVVILRPPDNPSVNYLKRIIGIPGDNVVINKGEVFLNGQRLIEPYVDGQNTQTVGNQKIDVTLRADEYFVMGDNRNHSRDSRELGPIPQQNIVSHVWIRLFPFDKIKVIPNPKI